MNRPQRALLMSVLLVLMMSVFPKLNTWGAEISNDPSPHELINALSLESPEKATIALKEIYEMGDQVIPILISCKGNRNLYWGYNLGYANSQDLIYFPDKEGSARTHVTIEVTALYLIESIFRKDLEFAQSPFLIDRNLDKSKNKSKNSEKTINRAWSSVDRWIILLKKYGMNHLREKRINPLFKANASFWGSEMR